MAWLAKLAGEIATGIVIGIYRGRAIVARWQKEPDATDADRELIDSAWDLYDRMHPRTGHREPEQAAPPEPGADAVALHRASGERHGRDAGAGERGQPCDPAASDPSSERVTPP